MSYLQFDGDDHGGEVFIQLLQHDQLLQSQVEQPADKTQGHDLLENIMVLRPTLKASVDIAVAILERMHIFTSLFSFLLSMIMVFGGSVPNRDVFLSL